MPVGLEEWRVSVGSNNAARSHALGKLIRRKNPRSFLRQFISYLVALLTEGTWFASCSTSEPCTVTSHSPDVTTPTTCSSTHKNKKIGVVVMLCIGLFIAIVTGVLYRSGDIETNPGPKYDLILANLGKLQDSLWNARTKWFNLGLCLEIDEETLKMLKQNYPNGDDCFREMLSKWLKTVNPTWEKLLAALTRPSVDCGHVAAKIRQEQGIPEKKPNDKETSLSASANAIATTFEVYISRLPPQARAYLDYQLDQGHGGVDKDLYEIAEPMLYWKEKLSSHFGLTTSEIHDIEVGHNRDNPELQRRQVLSTWKNKIMLGATYRNLLRLFCEANHCPCAEAVCNVLIKRVATGT